MSAPRERGIIFSGESIPAILAGSKTQTRRVMKPQPVSDSAAEPGDLVFLGATTAENLVKCRESRGWNEAATGRLNGYRYRCPYGEPGTILWVRESAWYGPQEGRVEYVADFGAGEDLEMAETAARNAGAKKRSPIYMPRWASRITLELTGVKVERLQDISEEDAIAEGMLYNDGMGIGHSGWRHTKSHGYVYSTAREAYAVAWDTLNARRGHPWEANDYVWALTFRTLPPESA